MSTDVSTTSSTASKDADPNLLLDDKDITCPVCKEVFVYPRTYECGHTVCEECMYQMDSRDYSGDTHTASIHHCPVCRHPTLRSWHNRPLSIILGKIAAIHPDYLDRKKEVLEKKNKRDTSIVYIPSDIDLAAASHNARIKMTLSLYEILLERLYKAAGQGLNHLIIKERGIVADIEKVIDMLSVQLFNKHNIYKILVTRGECTIYITKKAFTWRRDYQNSSWSQPGSSSTAATDETEEAPPSTPSSPGTTTREEFSAVLNTLLGPPGSFSRRLSRRSRRISTNVPPPPPPRDPPTPP